MLMASQAHNDSNGSDFHRRQRSEVKHSTIVFQSYPEPFRSAGGPIVKMKCSLTNLRLQRAFRPIVSVVIDGRVASAVLGAIVGEDTKRISKADLNLINPLEVPLENMKNGVEIVIFAGDQNKKIIGDADALAYAEMTYATLLQAMHYRSQVSLQLTNKKNEDLNRRLTFNSSVINIEPSIDSNEMSNNGKSEQDVGEMTSTKTEAGNFQATFENFEKGHVLFPAVALKDKHREGDVYRLSVAVSNLPKLHPLLSDNPIVAFFLKTDDGLQFIDSTEWQQDVQSANFRKEVELPVASSNTKFVLKIYNAHSYQIDEKDLIAYSDFTGEQIQSSIDAVLPIALALSHTEQSTAKKLQKKNSQVVLRYLSHTHFVPEPSSIVLRAAGCFWRSDPQLWSDRTVRPLPDEALIDAANEVAKRYNVAALLTAPDKAADLVDDSSNLVECFAETINLQNMTAWMPMIIAFEIESDGAIKYRANSEPLNDMEATGHSLFNASLQLNRKATSHLFKCYNAYNIDQLKPLDEQWLIGQVVIDTQDLFAEAQQNEGEVRMQLYHPNNFRMSRKLKLRGSTLILRITESARSTESQNTRTQQITYLNSARQSYARRNPDAKPAAFSIDP